MLEQVESVVTGEVILWGRPLLRWYISIAAFLGILLVLLALKIIGSKRYKKYKTELDQEFKWSIFSFFLLGKINFWSSLFVALYAASEAVNPIAKYDKYFKFVFIFGVFLQLFIWANSAINIYTHQKLRNNLKQNATSTTAINVFSLIWKFFAFSILALIMLDQMGFNITTLLAGLGVGGIAIALAVQNILGDLFASLTIVFDKPFKVGDAIQVDQIIGTVEKVGLKTTRIRSVTGEQIVISNADILKTRLQNFDGIIERRMFFKLGVTYDTPYEKMKMIPSLIEKAIMEQAKTRVDRVHFREYGESSLNFEVSYYIAESTLKLACDIQQEVNLAILKSFEDNGISFAFPSRTIYLQKEQLS